MILDERANLLLRVGGQHILATFLSRVFGRKIVGESLIMKIV